MISNRWKILAAALPIIGTCAFAQPQPGGLGGFFSAWWGAATISGTWTPLEMPNLIAWWTVTDPDSISVVAGTNFVTEWRDKSGNDYHFTQTITNRRPAYRDDVVSGQKVIDFTENISGAARPHMLLSTNIGGSNKFYSIVYRKVSTGNSVIFTLDVNSYDYLQYGNNWYIANTIQSVPINTNDFTMRAAWTAISGQQQQRYSNAVATAGTTYLSNLGMDGIGNPFGLQVSDISVREVVYVDGNPATEDRQKLEGYLAWNNGIESFLPADHPYRNAPP